MKKEQQRIVLYDGECGFCNRSVSFVLKHEKANDIHFSPLQSDFTKKLFESNNWSLPDLNTVYFIEGEKRHERSTAALQILKYMKAPVSWLRVFRIVPRPLRDAVYNFVAKRRQRLAKGYCVLPNPEQRKRFIE